LTHAKEILYNEASSTLSSSRSLDAKLCRLLFKDTAQATMLCTQDLIENGRVDGIYLSDVEVCSEHGKEQVVYAVKRLIDILCNCYEDSVS
jgi:hypothetical protein